MPSTLQSVRGSAQLAFEALAGIAGSVERMHETIALRPLPWATPPDRRTRAHGLIASTVYQIIQRSLHASARGVDLALGLLREPATVRAAGPRELHTLAALNGETLPKWIPSQESVFFADDPNLKEIAAGRKY